MGVRSFDQGCLARGPAQDPCLLTSLARPTQDISPEECVYIHDPTGLNVLKKGCAYYCNQTIQVSLGMGRSLPGDPGHWGTRGTRQDGWVGCHPQRAVLHPKGGKGVPEGPRPPPAADMGPESRSQLDLGVSVAPNRPSDVFSYRNLAAAKGFLGLTVYSVLGAFPTPAMAKAT